MAAKKKNGSKGVLMGAKTRKELLDMVNTGKLGAASMKKTAKKKATKKKMK